MRLINPNAPRDEQIFLLCGLILFFGIIFGGIGVIAYNSFPHPDKVDYDCVDFSSQNDAQSYFTGQGGSKTKNIDNLDEDGNGLACESLHHINIPQVDNSD